MAQGEAQHRGHVQLVAGGHDHEVREQPHVGGVEDAVVRRAVGAGQAGAVQAERHRQVLQGHLLEDLVERPLQERGVDVHDRPHARLGQAGGEGDRVRFADAGVEEAVGEVGPHLFQLVALAHGRRDDRDLRVVLHRLVDGGAGRVGVGLARRRASATGWSAPGPTFSKTGGVWYVTGSSLACGTPWPFSVRTCSRTGPFWSLTSRSQRRSDGRSWPSTGPM